MGDLKHPALLYLKGACFLLLGIMASSAILLQSPSLRIAGLLLIAIWAFCRAYYFVFYVIQHYVDPEFRYSGLLSLVRYWWNLRRTPPIRE